MRWFLYLKKKDSYYGCMFLEIVNFRKFIFISVRLMEKDKIEFFGFVIL